MRSMRTQTKRSDISSLTLITKIRRKEGGKKVFQVFLFSPRSDTAVKPQHFLLSPPDGPAKELQVALLHNDQLLEYKKMCTYYYSLELVCFHVSACLQLQIYSGFYQLTFPP